MIIYLFVSIIIAVILTLIGLIEAPSDNRPTKKISVVLTLVLIFFMWVLAWPLFIGVIIVDVIKS